MKQFMVLALSLVLTAGAVAAPAPQNATTPGTKRPKKRAAVVNPVTKRLDDMQQAISAQQ